jgi:uncharacterized membrane protein
VRRRLVHLAAALTLSALVVPAGTALSAPTTATTIPAGGGVDQYVETLPSAGGGIPSGSVGKSGGSRARPADTRSSGGGIGMAGLIGIVLAALAVTTVAGVLLRRKASSPDASDAKPLA